MFAVRPYRASQQNMCPPRLRAGREWGLKRGKSGRTLIPKACSPTPHAGSLTAERPQSNSPTCQRSHGGRRLRGRIAALVIFTSFEIRFVPPMNGVRGEPI